MVSLDEVRRAIATSYKSRPLVAVLVGATSGIGENAAKALAAACSSGGSKLRMYIVGRNGTAADRIISECRRVCPKGEFQFVKANDVSLISDVDQTSSTIIQLETKRNDNPRIDVLIMSQGQVVFGGRKETKEGLDMQFSLLYYSRIRFVLKLLPLLTVATHSAHVISVFGAGLEGAFAHDDKSLRNPKTYSIAAVRSHTCHMATMAFEHLARQHPKLSLVHVYPGLVITPAFADPALPIWFKVLWRVIGPLLSWYRSTGSDENGLRMVFLGTERFVSRGLSDRLAQEAAVGSDGSRGSGAYSVNEKGDVTRPKADYPKLRSQGFEDEIWKHTMSAFAATEAGRPFEG